MANKKPMKLQSVVITYSNGKKAVFTGEVAFETQKEMQEVGRITEVKFTPPFVYEKPKKEKAGGKSTKLSSASSEKGVEMVKAEKGLSEISEGVLPVQEPVSPANESINKEG